jgi:hypothetical protein
MVSIVLLDERLSQHFFAFAQTSMENAFEFLETPGEWFLSESQALLFYMPRSGEDLRSAVTIVSQVEQLLTVAGTVCTGYPQTAFGTSAPTACSDCPCIAPSDYTHCRCSRCASLSANGLQHGERKVANSPLTSNSEPHREFTPPSTSATSQTNQNTATTGHADSNAR